jgi:hypothetical protein
LLLSVSALCMLQISCRQLCEPVHIMLLWPSWPQSWQRHSGCNCGAAGWCSWWSCSWFTGAAFGVPAAHAGCASGALVLGTGGCSCPLLLLIPPACAAVVAPLPLVLLVTDAKPLPTHVELPLGTCSCWPALLDCCRSQVHHCFTAVGPGATLQTLPMLVVVVGVA